MAATQTSVPITVRDEFFRDPFFNPFWEFVERRIHSFSSTSLLKDSNIFKPRSLPRLRYLLSEADNVLNSWDSLLLSDVKKKDGKTSTTLPVVKEIPIEREPDSPPVIMEMSRNDSIDSISTTAELGSVRRFDVLSSAPPVVSEAETPRETPMTPSFSSRTTNAAVGVQIQDITTPKTAPSHIFESSTTSSYNKSVDFNHMKSTTPSIHSPKTRTFTPSTSTTRTETPTFHTATPTPRTSTPLSSSSPTPVPAHSDEIRDVPVQLGSEASSRFQVILDMNQYRPHEVTVKATSRWALVEAQHDESLDADNYVSRRYVRKFSLPPGVESAKLSAAMSADRILTIDAPRKVPDTESSAEVIIPIRQTGVNALS